MNFSAFEMAGFCGVRGLGEGNFGATSSREIFVMSMDYFNIIDS